MTQEKHNDVQRVKLSSLENWARNPRESLDLARLKKILTKRGQTHPLIVDARDKKTVLGGNMRLAAMRELKWQEADVVYVTVDNDSEAVQIAFEDNDQFGKYIQDQVIQLATEFSVDTNVQLTLNPVKLGQLLAPDDELQDDEDIDGKEFKPTYQVVIDCANENEQELTYHKLTEQGITCRVLTL